MSRSELLERLRVESNVADDLEQDAIQACARARAQRKKAAELARQALGQEAAQLQAMFIVPSWSRHA